MGREKIQLSIETQKLTLGVNEHGLDAGIRLVLSVRDLIDRLDRAQRSTKIIVSMALLVPIALCGLVLTA